MLSALRNTSILLGFLFFLSGAVQAQVLRKRTTKLMGARFDISIVGKDSVNAEENIDSCIAEIMRIENLISDWKSETQIGQVNANAGIRPVKVSSEVFALAQRALRLSEETDGAFDISFAAMDRIWRFDGSMTVMPAPAAVKQSVAKVNHRNVILDGVNSTIYLRTKGMKIGFGALGEGYAADRCRQLMLAKGVAAGIVNGSGDMSTWGSQPDGTDWSVGITNPMRSDTLLAVVPLKQGAVVTSGSYEKFVMFNGKRYAHIINPKTGYPVTGLCSVTIFGPNAERANGLSTSIMVLGEKRGLELLSRNPGYSGLLITDSGRIITSCDELSRQLGLENKN